MSTHTQDLLAAYTQAGSQEAFSALVADNIGLVYAAALRRVNGDAHKAQDISQIVFTDLARKANSLPADVRLAGWLHRHTCFVASTWLRSEQRRHNREQLAAEMSMNATHDGWMELAPIIDEAVDQLEEVDREAVLLRFFEGCSLSAVGTALGMSEDAAQKRVSRALDKLRVLLAQKGVVLSASALLALFSVHNLSGAPTGLAWTVSQAALKSIATEMGAGFLAMIAQWLAIGKTKLALCLAGVALISLPLFWTMLNRTNAFSLDHSIRANPSNLGISSNRQVIAGESNAENRARPKASQTPNSARVLHLEIVAAESGKPVPGVELDCQINASRQTQYANRVGQKDLPLPEDLAQLRIGIRVDGFADSLLYWRPDRGVKVPASYIVKLVRPVTVGGIVLAPDGSPAADAEVFFSFGQPPEVSDTPEYHRFFNVAVYTDEAGKWQLNRLAPDAISQFGIIAHHRFYTDSQPGGGFATNSLAWQQLREGTYALRLGSAATAAGQVVDEAGEPVVGAQVLVGRNGESGSREGYTDLDGHFEIRGCKFGATFLSSHSPGLMLLTTNVDLKAENDEFKLVMQPVSGLPMRFRLVDGDGLPVPGQVNLDSANPQWSPQIQPNRDTTPDGRWAWPEAPQVEMEFYFQAAGFAAQSKFKGVPDGKEHTIVMSRILSISGTVSTPDGQPVSKLRLSVGRPVSNAPEGAAKIQWSNLNAHPTEFLGGKYQLNVDHDCILKFDVDGFAPSLTRVIRAIEGIVHLNVTLKKARMVQVILPDGSPARDAVVDLLYAGGNMRPFASTGLISGGPGAIQCFIADQANGQGQYKHPEDPSLQRLMIFHPEGFINLAAADASLQRTISLEKWGRIEGICLSNGEPSPKGQLILQMGTDQNDSLHPESLPCSVDEQGRFVIQKAPPGMHRLSWIIPSPDGQGSQPVSVARITVRPGEVLSVTCTNLLAHQ